MSFEYFIGRRDFCSFVENNVCCSFELYFDVCFRRDNLLLEAGFLCVLIAPFWYPSKAKPSTPSDAVTFWTARWLLFRLLFSSGVVKLTSGCPSWWNLEGKVLDKYLDLQLSFYLTDSVCNFFRLSALTVHFESQCIPTPLAWYAHHLPAWYLRLNTVTANVFELIIPFLFFFPNRKVRITAFYLQVSIATLTLTEST